MKHFEAVVTQDLFDDSTFYVAKGTQLGLIPPQRKYNPTPPFSRIGNGMQGKQGTSYPLLQTMLEFTKPEAWFFSLLLKAHQEDTGLSDISNLNFSKTELNTLSKAYLSLHSRNLVKRIRRQVYMINPNAIITSNWKDHNNLWNKTP